MGVDTTKTYSSSSTGRDSVRIQSKNKYTHGLFIADMSHMPCSACGTAASFWTFGTGEIDIIEYASLYHKSGRGSC